MFPTMQTRILNIRASQSNGNTVSFSGVFTGYRNAERTSLSLNIDPDSIQNKQPPKTAANDYAALVAEPLDVET